MQLSQGRRGRDLYSVTHNNMQHSSNIAHQGSQGSTLRACSFRNEFQGLLASFLYARTTTAGQASQHTLLEIGNQDLQAGDHGNVV